MLLILYFGAILISFLYTYFTQMKQGNVIWWSIPISLMIGFVIMVTLLVVFVALFSLTCSKKENDKLPKFHHFIIKVISKLLIDFFRICVQIENEDLIPKDGKFLFVSNHQSNFDGVIMPWVLSKYKPTFIMKKSILRIPVVGRVLRAAGYLPIDRENDRETLKAVIKISNRVKQGGNIAVFPEGTRSRTDEMLPFRHGVFKIAQKGEAPIVIATIDGFRNIRKNIPWKKSKVLVRICEVIPYNAHKNLHTNEIGEYVHQVIERNLKQIRNEYLYLK